jgi:tetratricopeptide (TPR) repeat protein
MMSQPCEIEVAPGRRGLALLVFAVALVIYAATLPRQVLPGDSGELIAASHTLSIAHPPGYPLYVMIGKIFATLLAVGSVAFRYNLLSAVAASGAAAVFLLVLTRLGIGRALALALSLALATLEAFWLQATTAEVYALNVLLTVLLFYTALLGRRWGDRAFMLLGFIGGLSLAHHLSLAYPFLSALVIMILGFRMKPRLRSVMIALLLLGLGLTTWLYVPIRASLGAPAVWDRTHTLSGFYSHVTAQGYGWRVKALDLAGRSRDLIGFFKILTAQGGPLLTLFAAAGLVTGIRRRRELVGFLVLIALFAVHLAVYNIPDIESHIFPALVGLAVLAAVGLQGLGKLERLWKPAGLLGVAVAVIVVILNLVALRPRQDQWFAQDYADAIRRSALVACGDSCLIISSGDPASFPLLYDAAVHAGPVTVFDLGISNPALIGAAERPRTVERCVEIAAEQWGISRIALLGPTPPAVLGNPTRICGMVYVMDAGGGECPGPETYTIRGVGRDLRDYSSRLLSGSYFIHLARWRLEQGDTAGTRHHLEQAVRVASDDVGTHIYAARLLLQSGRGADALRLAETALRLDPDFFEAHDLMANLLFMAGRTSEAVAEYRLALKGNPNPAPAYSNLGNAYASLGQHSQALESFRQAVELDSALVNAHIGIGRSLEALGRPDEALVSLGRARSLDPRSVPARHAEASLLIRVARYDAAITVLRDGLHLIPESPLLESDMGLCFLRTDALDSAVIYFERALGRDPMLLTARGNLAVAYERQGDVGKAMEHYTIYAETAPPGNLRERAKEALRRLGGGFPAD